MKIEIVYTSRTGTTANASQEMADILRTAGHECRVQSVEEANPADIIKADMVFIGTWVRGAMPTYKIMRFIRKLHHLEGKQVAVFCTYDGFTGITTGHMTRALENRGANVIAGFKHRRGVLSDDFKRFVMNPGEFEMASSSAV